METKTLEELIEQMEDIIRHHNEGMPRESVVDDLNTFVDDATPFLTEEGY
jgi:hypothetical protein